MYSLHTEALAWLRYAKRLPVVCTEAGSWNADVIGLNGKMVIEVEVKKSKADLRAEFRSKPAKHYVYDQASEFDPKTSTGFVPNYFYFFVAAEVADMARDFVAEKAPKAGVVAVRWPARSPVAVGRASLEILKPAVKLHGRKPSQRFLHAAMMRMGSEICGFRIALDALKAGAPLTRNLIESLVDAARHGTTTLDFEDGLQDLEKRAAELAEAVDGLHWHQIGSAVEKFRWMEAARKLLEKKFENADLVNEQVS